MFECSWRSTFGVDCLTCGVQRSLELLMDGKVLESFLMFPALIPMLITFVLLFTHLLFKLKHGARYITYAFGTSAFLILLNFTIKLATGHAFH